MKVWALMWYGIDEADCVGVVSSRQLAKEWEKRNTLYNQAIAFEVDKMPALRKRRCGRVA